MKVAVAGRAAGSPKAQTAGSPCSSGVLVPGTRVRVIGIQRCPEYNGREGELVDFDEAEGRWRLLLDDGTRLLLNPDNLEDPDERPIRRRLTSRHPPGCHQFVAACLDGLLPQPRRERGPNHGFFGEGAVVSRTTKDGVMDRMRLNGPALPGDLILARLAFAVRGQLEPPRRTGIRRVCLVVHRHGCEDGELGVEVASTAECCNAAGGCSAEQSALAKLMTWVGVLPVGGPARGLGLGLVEKLVVVSDAPHIVLPDAVSREMLAEHLAPSVPLLLGCYESGRLHLQTVTVADLYPFPLAYRHVPCRDVAMFARSLGARCAPVPVEQTLVQKVFLATLAAVRKDAQPSATSPSQEAKASNTEMNSSCQAEAEDVTPVYAAGVGFADGNVEVCVGRGQSSATSSGVLVWEGITQLAFRLQDRDLALPPPCLFLVSDQWGVLHAPFSAGRSILVECFRELSFVVHSPEKGDLRELRCRELLPDLELLKAELARAEAAANCSRGEVANGAADTGVRSVDEEVGGGALRPNRARTAP